MNNRNNNDENDRIHIDLWVIVSRGPSNEKHNFQGLAIWHTTIAGRDCIDVILRELWPYGRPISRPFGFQRFRVSSIR